MRMLSQLISIGSVTALMFGSCENNKVEPIHSLFILNVSNQSVAINPIDIKVSIDSIIYIDQEFEVGDKHNWKEFTIELEKGSHIIRVESELANVALEERFELTNDTHWGLPDYFNDPSHPDNTERFHFEFSDTVIGLM